MQFQPYKGGGGPDFLSLALRIRQQRTQEESQKRRDEAALIRAQSKAENDELARQARRLEMAERYIGNVPDIAGLSRAVGEGQAAVEGAVDQFAPFSQVDTQTALDTAKADDAFGAIAGQLTARSALERQGESQLQPLEQALQTQIARQARLLKAARPELTDEQALGIAQRDVSASAFSQQAGEQREVAKTIAEETRGELIEKRREGRAAQRDLPQRQSRIEARVAAIIPDASVAYRASQNPNLSDDQQKKALADLDAKVDRLVPEYAAAFGVTPGQARRTIMAPIKGSPVVRAQVLQEQGVDITSKAIAEANSEVGAQVSLARDLRDAQRERKSADDPARIADLEDRIQSITNVRAALMAGEGEQPFSSGDRVKAMQSYLSGRSAMETTGELLALVESGQIKTGPAGLLTSLGLRVQELTNDILQDPEVPDEMKALVQQLEQSGNGQIAYQSTVGTSLRGKQLNLAADQLFLAWEIVKAKRESARFTLLELQSTLELVDFTDPTKPKEQMVEMLRKVVGVQNSASGISAVMLERMGIPPDVLYDQYKQQRERIGIDRPAPASQPRASAGGGEGVGANRTDTPASDLIPGSAEYAAEMARRIANGTYVGGGR